jgi:uncharacterized protein with GYD domain
MAKFLIFGSYTQQGVQGLLKDGGSARRAAVKKLVSSVGGKLEGFYFTYGEDDVVLIADLPDGAAAAAVSLTVSASGAVNTRTVPLLTAEEIDAAVKQSPAYKPPGK